MGAAQVIDISTTPVADGLAAATGRPGGRAADLVIDPDRRPRPRPRPRRTGPRGRARRPVDLPTAFSTREPRRCRCPPPTRSRSPSASTRSSASPASCPGRAAPNASSTPGRAPGCSPPVVDRVVALDEIAAAHRHLEPGARMGKVVVTAQSY
ncbi:zinc-binding dehydrogenase [Streptomyces sp. NBC_01803]|uniref:zinc-binding dehydrogenase n=1 Tax=Streptomyces sp. NBC_01803 TaxID=2975946 RepID=UPI003FA3D906